MGHPLVRLRERLSPQLHCCTFEKEGKDNKPRQSQITKVFEWLSKEIAFLYTMSLLYVDSFPIYKSWPYSVLATFFLMKKCFICTKVFLKFNQLTFYMILVILCNKSQDNIFKFLLVLLIF